MGIERLSLLLLGVFENGLGKGLVIVGRLLVNHPLIYPVA